ncbi:recombination protein NinB [Trinickia sp.]|uniref:recombination protein NinB n=1 Tax=Trinickia sp. TaxID=2571163 RepID=UPI003F81528B
MRTFVLREKEHAQSLVSYLKQHAGPQARAGRPLVVTVAEHKQKRSGEQNARYWALLSEIAEQVQVSGKYFDRDVWHEWMKDRFGPKIDGPTGLLPSSTSQMNTEQFNQYMTQVESFAVQELGVEFAAI